MQTNNKIRGAYNTPFVESSAASQQDDNIPALNKLQALRDFALQNAIDFKLPCEMTYVHGRYYKLINDILERR